MRRKVVAAIASLASALVLAAPENPYGIHVHMYDRDHKDRDRLFKAVAEMGLGTVRTDGYWHSLQPEKDGPFDFSILNRIVDSGLRANVRTEFILYAAPGWARHEWQHPEAYRRYVYETVKALGDRIRTVEIHNEMNVSHFWHANPDPAAYVRHLRIAYNAAKAANPAITVALGGVAGCDAAAEFLQGVYDAGGRDCFDEMNVHPYVCPERPEGNLDGQLERLKELMARNGDSGKPIVITETGYPTHRASDLPMKMIAAGLRHSNPAKKSWNVVFLVNGDRLMKISQGLARHFEKFMPEAKSECLIALDVDARLRAGGVDVVVNPFSEGYYSNVADTLVDFVKNGGTLVDFGGMPMWYALRCTGKGSDPVLDSSADVTQDRENLRIGVTADWMDKNIPKYVDCEPTEAGRAAGIELPGGSYKCRYFLTDRLLKPGDAFIPLVGGKAKDGSPVTSVAIYRFNSDFKGTLFLSTLDKAVPFQPVDEKLQALYLARTMGIGMAEGIRRIFWYDLRAREFDAGYSEHNFGIMHRDFSPKPALRTYAAFVKRRPAGSVQSAAKWRSDDGNRYFPQWKLPDGKAAGMIWSVLDDASETVTFDSGRVRFFDVYGVEFKPEQVAERSWRLTIGGSPVYFEGGALANTLRIEAPEGRRACGEETAFRVSYLDGVGGLLRSGSALVTVDNFGPAVQYSNRVDFAAANPLIVKGSLRKPGFLRVSVDMPGVSRNLDDFPCMYSVPYEQEKIEQGAPEPSDFDSFWAKAMADLDAAVPVDVQLKEEPARSSADWTMYRVSFASADRRVYAWVSIPKAKGPWPAMVSVPGAGCAMSPNRPSKNHVKMMISVFPIEPSLDEAENRRRFDALNASYKAKYGVPRYPFAGMDVSPREFFYYPVILGAARAVRWLAARPEVDRARIAYDGSSQGGAFGLYLAALVGDVFSHAEVRVPALTDTLGYLKGRNGGWPHADLEWFGCDEQARDVRIAKVMPYFDTCNFAARAKCPVTVLVGLSDWVCPPSAVLSAYNRMIRPDRRIVYAYGGEHGTTWRVAWEQEKLRKGQK